MMIIANIVITNELHNNPKTFVYKMKFINTAVIVAAVLDRLTYPDSFRQMINANTAHNAL